MVFDCIIWKPVRENRSFWFTASPKVRSNLSFRSKAWEIVTG